MSTEQQTSVDGDDSPQRSVTERLPSIQGVVVGDDCSRNASVAVEYAVDEAIRRGCDLHVVRSWNLTTAPRPSGWSVGYMPSMLEWEAAVLADLERTWGYLRERLPSSLYLLPVHRSPKEVLVDASDSADVLVIGARGRGRVKDWVLGSVADAVLKHALCPVVVIPQRQVPAATTD